MNDLCIYEDKVDISDASRIQISMKIRYAAWLQTD